LSTDREVGVFIYAGGRNGGERLVELGSVAKPNFEVAEGGGGGRVDSKDVGEGFTIGAPRSTPSKFAQEKLNATGQQGYRKEKKARRKKLAE